MASTKGFRGGHAASGIGRSESRICKEAHTAWRAWLSRFSIFAWKSVNAGLVQTISLRTSCKNEPPLSQAQYSLESRQGRKQGLTREVKQALLTLKAAAIRHYATCLLLAKQHVTCQPKISWRRALGRGRYDNSCRNVWNLTLGPMQPLEEAIFGECANYSLSL